MLSSMSSVDTLLDTDTLKTKKHSLNSDLEDALLREMINRRIAELRALGYGKRISIYHEEDTSAEAED